MAASKKAPPGKPNTYKLKSGDLIVLIESSPLGVTWRYLGQTTRYTDNSYAWEERIRGAEKVYK